MTLNSSSPALERTLDTATAEEVEELEDAPEDVIGGVPDAAGAMPSSAEEVMDEAPKIPTEGIVGATTNEVNTTSLHLL